MEKFTTQIRAPRNGDVGEVATAEYEVVNGTLWVRRVNGAMLQLHAKLAPEENAQQVARRLVREQVAKRKARFDRRIEYPKHCGGFGYY
jgi:hypothetical protein